jgi:hypothetical protein
MAVEDSTSPNENKIIFDFSSLLVHFWCFNKSTKTEKNKKRRRFASSSVCRTSIKHKKSFSFSVLKDVALELVLDN